MSTSAAKLAELKRRARDASRHAHAPYSQFTVGAAVLTESWEIFAGANVENASYGLSICTERNGIFQAVAHGARRIAALVLYTPTAKVNASVRRVPAGSGGIRHRSAHPSSAATGPGAAGAIGSRIFFLRRSGPVTSRKETHR